MSFESIHYMMVFHEFPFMNVCIFLAQFSVNSWTLGNFFRSLQMCIAGSKQTKSCEGRRNVKRRLEEAMGGVALAGWDRLMRPRNCHWKWLHIEGISLFCGSGYRTCKKQSVMTSSPYHVLPQFNFHGLKPSGIAGIAYSLSPLPEVKVVQELCAWKNTRVIARWCSSPIAKLAFIIPITGFQGGYIYIYGWWFQTWILCSISHMGCHPSHWLSYFSRLLKPPTSIYIYMYLNTFREETWIWHDVTVSHGSWQFYDDHDCGALEWFRKSA